MAEGQSAAREAVDSATAKETLQQQMLETRESISQTVTDIKDTVVDGVQSVKDTVADTLDWREQFRSHPLAWCVGALSIGYVLGNSVIAAIRDAKDEDQLLSHLAALGEHFTDQLSKQGMSLLAPALTGTVLVPVLTSKLKELTGLDLSDAAQQLFTQGDGGGSVATKPKRNGKKRKAGGKKQGKRKKSKSSSA